ncbi:MAG: acetyl-CoA C-acetyltransferase [Firmicutes bacterium]|nr:acetyl-CoA C-acetyltransferase [Bacillota bacterium]
MEEAVIVAGARTPFVTFGGALREVPAVDLGAVAIQGALARSGMLGEDVDYVWMGQVVQAGAGQIPSRQATIKAGLPNTVPSETVNKVCASSLRAVNLAEMAIRAGDVRVAVAGGMESMSQAPYLVKGARYGLRMGDVPFIDAVIHDGLWCSFGQCHMGVYGSEVAREYGIGREAQDDWAFQSHQRAIQAIDSGKLAEEIVPVSVPGKKGPNVQVAADVGPRRDTTREIMGRLRPAFQPDGTVTAGNAPGLTDGAAALVLMSRAEAERRGIQPLARVVAAGWASREPKYLHTVPAYAAQMALARAGLTVRDVKLWEINEAFAAVTLTSMQLLELDGAQVNVNGGAVALGHPIGATGARILLTLILELRRRGGGYGMAAICSGGGQGEATLVLVD